MERQAARGLKKIKKKRLQERNPEWGAMRGRGETRKKEKPKHQGTRGLRKYVTQGEVQRKNDGASQVKKKTLKRRKTCAAKKKESFKLVSCFEERGGNSLGSVRGRNTVRKALESYMCRGIRKKHQKTVVKSNAVSALKEGPLNKRGAVKEPPREERGTRGGEGEQRHQPRTRGRKRLEKGKRNGTFINFVSNSAVTRLRR